MKQEIKEEIVEDFKKAKKANKKNSSIKLEEDVIKEKKAAKKKELTLNLEDTKVIKKADPKGKKAKEEILKKQEELNQKIKQKNKEKKHEQIMQDMVKKRKTINILISLVLILIILGIIFSTIFALLNINNENIFKNTYVSNINISNISKEEAIDKLLIAFNAVSDKPINLKFEDYQRDVTPNDIDFEVLAERTVAKAYNIGRTTNIFKNNFVILNSYLTKTNIELEYTYDRQLLEQIVSDISVKIPGKTIESTHTIKNDKLTINRGTAGIDVISEDLINKIITSFISLETELSITIPTKATLPEPINIEKISQEITKKAEDASYDTKTKVITPETNGVEFAVSITEAKALISEVKDQYVIPLKITIPKMTTDAIKDKYNLYVFDDVLAKETTYYDATYWTRSTNMEVATKQINGTVIKPGQEFSFNSFVGDTSAADGYQMAIGYAGGKSVPMMGGGVCQISSQIYSAALKANLKITERYNHVCPVSYLPPGQDATTALGSCDLKFVNNRTEPIKLVIKTSNGVSSVEIRGVKEPNEPVIKLISTKINTVPFNTIYIQDSSLKKGQQVVDTYGITGYTSKLYKETYVNGILIDKSLISQDTYQPLHQIIRRNSN